MKDLVASASNDRFDFTYLATRPHFQIALTVIALIAVVLFGAFEFFYEPYSGMEIFWVEEFGKVSAVYPSSPADRAGVLVGDQLLSINGLPLVQWSNVPAYPTGIHAGDTLNFEFQRGQETLHIPIVVGRYLENWNWFWYEFVTIFLAISFWLMGAAMCLFSPANDVRSRLLGLGFLLAGMTAIVGLASGWNSFWGANTLGIILRVWLGPVYVAAHFSFPTSSLPKYRKIIINGFVLIASVLTILVLVSTWMSSPGMLTVSGEAGSIAMDLRRVAQIFFIISLLVGISLLVYNRVNSKDAEVRRQTNVVLWGNVLGFSPYLIFVVLPYTFLGVLLTAGLTSLVFLVLVPLSYIYIIYQRKLLRVDFVINRFVVLFVLALLVLILSILILGMLSLVFSLPPGVPFLGGLVAVLIVLPSATLQRNVQVRVNRVLYGNHYDFSTVTAGFSSRLAVTLDRNTLNELLTRDLTSQMGIQQAALFLADGENLALQPTQGHPVMIPMEDAVSRFLLDVRTPVRSQYLWRAVPESSQKPWQAYDWGELFVPMVFEGQLHGILILGERVSADVYSDTDVQIIATIAYQGALAFENILLVETLRGLTRRLVRADEDQRRKIARDLHDGVLQDLFFIRQQLLRDQVEIAGHLENIIDQLRRTIKTQRTVLLDQGLELALESLVVDMQSLARDRSQIVWNNAVDRNLNLTDEQATSIYRIVQEAISNAIKHAQAEYIRVRIENPTNDVLIVSVEDNGVGIKETEGGAAGDLHYGLVGMKERALMIGADLNVESDVGEGTMVTLELNFCI